MTFSKIIANQWDLKVKICVIHYKIKKYKIFVQISGPTLRYEKWATNHISRKI